MGTQAHVHMCKNTGPHTHTDTQAMSLGPRKQGLRAGGEADYTYGASHSHKAAELRGQQRGGGRERSPWGGGGDSPI